MKMQSNGWGTTHKVSDRGRYPVTTQPKPLPFIISEELWENMAASCTYRIFNFHKPVGQN